MKITQSIFLTVAVFFGFTFSANAGVPVVDVAALTQAAESYVQMGLQLAQQIESYEQQVQQYETQLQQLTNAQNSLNAITGTRNMAGLANSPSMRQVAPAPTYNDLSTTAGAQAAAAQTAAQLQSATNRTSMLQTLASNIDTSDAKAAADLQNRILAEQAFMMNEAAAAQAGKDNQLAQAAVQANADNAAANATLFGSSSPDFK